MINNDNEYSTDTVTTKSKTITFHENNSIMSPTVNLSNPTGEEQFVQNTDNDPNERESQNNQLVNVQNEQEEEKEGDNNDDDDDEFIRITAAHQMLTEAQAYDEKKKLSSCITSLPYMC